MASKHPRNLLRPSPSLLYSPQPWHHRLAHQSRIILSEASRATSPRPRILPTPLDTTTVSQTVESLPRPPVRAFFLLDFHSPSPSKAPTPLLTHIHQPSLPMRPPPMSSTTRPLPLYTLPIRPRTMATTGICLPNTFSLHCPRRMPIHSTNTRCTRRLPTTTTLRDTTPHHRRRRRTRRLPQRPAHTHYPKDQARSALLQRCKRTRSPSADLSPPSRASARRPSPGQVQVGVESVR